MANENINGLLASIRTELEKQTSQLTAMVDAQKEASKDAKRAGLLGRKGGGKAPAVAPGAISGANQAIGGSLAAVGGLGAGIGGLAAALGSGALGLALPVLSAGVSSFANPAFAIGATALTAFLAGLGGVTWLFGAGVDKVGEGIGSVADGLSKLNETGKTIDTANLVKAGDDLNSFLSQAGSWGSASGAAVTFLTGDLSGIADGMTALNDAGKNVESQSLTDAANGLNAFLSALGEGSLWDSISGAITTSILPDMTSLATGIKSLNGAAVDIDPDAMKAMGGAIGEIAKPLAKFSAGGIVANFVGDNALTDLSDGLTALNKAEVDRISEVKTAFEILNEEGGLLSFIGSGFAANFVGNNAFPDLADGLSALNTAQIDNIDNVTNAFKTLDEDGGLFDFIKSGFVANFVGDNAYSDLADGLSALNGAEVNNIATVVSAFKKLNEKDGLFAFIGAGFVANFVGKNAITDLADGASYLNAKLGTEEALEQATYADAAMRKLKGGLLSFTAGAFVSQLTGAVNGLLSFFTGSESPIEQAIQIADSADDLQKGATALESLVGSLDRMTGLQFDGRKLKLKEFADDLVESVPAIEAAIMGGTIEKWGAFNDIDFKGLASPDIKYEEAIRNITALRQSLGYQVEAMSVNIGEQANGGTGSLVAPRTVTGSYNTTTTHHNYYTSTPGSISTDPAFAQ